MIIKSKVPLRVSFAGGSTDVSPYPEQYGGSVISTTINKYAYAFLKPRDDKMIRVCSYDYDVSEVIKDKTELNNDGSLGLVKETIKTMHVGDKGLELIIYSEAPIGSGLGSSSAVVVAVIGAFKEWLYLPLTSYEIAKMAYHIEREILGIAGGYQDQYASTFGGFNFIEFFKNSIIVSPLRIRPEVLNELTSNLLLVDTKKTRLSSNILSRQQESYRFEVPEVMESLHEIKKLAVTIRNSLLLGNLKDFGYNLDREWFFKKKLDSMISNPEIDSIYTVAKGNGALGAKLIGAGGGGHFIFYCDYGKKVLVQRAVEKLGCYVVPFCFESYGLQTWKIDNGMILV